MHGGVFVYRREGWANEFLNNKKEGWAQGNSIYSRLTIAKCDSEDKCVQVPICILHETASACRQMPNHKISDE